MKIIKKVKNIFVDRKRDLYLQSLLKTKQVLMIKGDYPDSSRKFSGRDSWFSASRLTVGRVTKPGVLTKMIKGD
jgi:hypothetical protein